MPDTGWFKSTRSGAANDNCVEVRITEVATRVRDSKNSTKSELVLGRAAFAAFVTAVK